MANGEVKDDKSQDALHCMLIFKKTTYFFWPVLTYDKNVRTN